MNIYTDNIKANWPSTWTQKKIDSMSDKNNIISKIFSNVSKNFHAKAAYHVLPSLKFNSDDRQYMDQERSDQINASEGKIKRICFNTSDNIKIDGAIIWNELTDASSNSFTNKPWILYFNGNNESYEENLQYLKWYSQETQCNILCFNYRGVGDSEGFPYHSIELSLDGDAAFQFLTRQGVKSNQILIHARSLGGAVGTKVRSYHPEGPICNERSFWSWRAVEESLFNQKYSRFYNEFLQKMEWDFDPITDWNKIDGKKWIIVSKTDEVINYNNASFAKKIIRNSNENSIIIEMPDMHSALRGNAPEGHNIMLKSEELKEIWETHKEFLKTAFNQGG